MNVAEHGGFLAWLRHATVRDGSLATPTRVLWHSYRRFCAAWGFATATADGFAEGLRGEPGVGLMQVRGRGVTNGVGLAPREATHDRETGT